MMITNNLFSMFDPSSKTMNPFIVTTLFMLMTNKKMMSKKTKTTKNMMNNSFKKIYKNKKTSNQMTMILMSSTMIIMIMNLMSLTPFSWSQTSHFSMNIPTVMILFNMIMILTAIKKKKMFMIHMIPMGTPWYLIPFMFVIEITSWSIRPITLTMRLTANMISGHILLHLISSTNLTIQLKMMKTISLIMSTTFLTMEIMVSMIQAMILTYLINLYMEEN